MRTNNVRIASIESGESIAAEDEDIKTGDTPLAAGRLNPALSPASTPDIALPAAAPAASHGVPALIDLDSKANPTSAGQFTGKKNEVGLLGGTDFHIAWREDRDIKLSGKPIEIYSLRGLRKAVTQKGYGGRLAVWNPTASRHPFWVARRDTTDADGKPNGGFVYFIQWNGESYDEVWKSNQIGDEVIDMQVCDSKGEGKTGLVILSRQDKNYFLTKIVLAE